MKREKSQVISHKSQVQCKIKNFAFWAVILIFAFCILHLDAFAQSISSSELIKNAKQYDGKAVTYEGEVIGDVMERGDYAWVNVNDGKNALGIWIAKDLTKDILYAGSYKTKGDWVEISGIFQRACPEHGGDLDIHAQSIGKIQPGRTLNIKLNPDKKNFALVLLGIVFIVWILRLLRAR